VRILVITLTRDRLEYTQPCFRKLRENAGCEFEHWVLDNGSRDYTPQWLTDELNFAGIQAAFLRDENLGISGGMNFVLDKMDEWEEDFDVIVKFDNDCELTEPDTLRTVAELTLAGNAILSPRILGLNNPPQATGTFNIADRTIEDIPQIGGIFLSVPGKWYDSYRYPTDGPLWGLDDSSICHAYRKTGGRCGYVKGLTANHYETTSGQHARFPEYFQRTLAEGKPSL
jgi:glycosyltransferase involved in cell wall biosynthesis